MTKNRMEAFSDGVLAIIITIMVLELKVPHGSDLSTLAPLLPIFLSYILSFIYIGIYWNNHHHLLYTITNVSGGILWANLHLLFWLSLFPFITGWMGENHFSMLPTAAYGIVLLMASIAFYILQLVIIKQGKSTVLKQAIGKNNKGKFSSIIYIIAVTLVCVNPLISQVLYAVVALMWIVPDKRIERVLFENKIEN